MIVRKGGGEGRGGGETSIVDAGVKLDDYGATSDRFEEIGRRLHRASAAAASLFSAASAPLLSSSAHFSLCLKLEMAWGFALLLLQSRSFVDQRSFFGFGLSIGSIRLESCISRVNCVAPVGLDRKPDCSFNSSFFFFQKFLFAKTKGYFFCAVFFCQLFQV